MLLLLFVFFAAAATPGVSAPINDTAPLWYDDILIWDMTENSTWAGPGLTYCTGIFGPGGMQYAASIIDSTDVGSVLKIFSTENGGYSWLYENWITGGSFVMTDPEMELSSEIPSNYLYVFYTATSTSMVIPIGIRFILPDLTPEAGLVPDWPASDALLSVEAVCHPETGELWVFGDDSDHNINLSRSTDNGDNWTTAELVATDAILPSAAPGPAGWVYLTYRRITDNKIMSVSFGETSYYETEVADGGDTSAPIIASEQAGSEKVGIIYHDASFDIRMALSDDHGATWNLSDIISKGYYPFIDVFRQSSNCALAYIDFTTENIYYASATSFDQLLSYLITYSISDETVFQGGPPVIRHGDQALDVGLFYMSPGSGGDPAPQDMWYDNSLFTSIGACEEIEISGTAITAGPNPFSGFCSIEFSTDEPCECSLDIYSMDGRLVESAYYGVSTGEIVIAGENLPTGVYSIVLRTGSEIVTKRIVKF